MRTSVLIACVLLAGCRDPRAEANIAQAMMEVGNTLSEMRQDFAMLQSTVDSLRDIVAKQDSMIGRLSSHTGLPYTPR
jgi:hypothetical protein